jgi:hypothetical protein
VHDPVCMKMAASLGTHCARRPRLAAPVAGQGDAKPLAFVFTEKPSLRVGPESSFVRTELSSKDGDHRGYPQRKRELQLQGFFFVTVS